MDIRILLPNQQKIIAQLSPFQIENSQFLRHVFFIIACKRTTRIPLMHKNRQYLKCLQYFSAELHKQVTVDCDFDQMLVHIEKSLIPEFKMSDVRLLDPNCQPTKFENSSHITISAPLIGCGTTLEHTKDSLIYRNMVKDVRVTQSVISRLQVCFLFVCF